MEKVKTFRKLHPRCLLLNFFFQLQFQCGAHNPRHQVFDRRPLLTNHCTAYHWPVHCIANHNIQFHSTEVLHTIAVQYMKTTPCLPATALKCFITSLHCITVHPAYQPLHCTIAYHNSELYCILWRSLACISYFTISTLTISLCTLLLNFAHTGLNCTELLVSPMY